MARNKKDPYFYEPIKCSECPETEGLFKKHKHNDDLLCEECVNKLARLFEEEDNREGYYTDMSYGELIAEREA